MYLETYNPKIHGPLKILRKEGSEMEEEQTKPWWSDRLLENGKLSDKDTTSEYERGFIDCWNRDFNGG